MAKKTVWLPYDFDTALGINNEGALVFSYDLEDIDYTSGGADIYNGQDSVLWKNVREAYAEEIKAMYQELRSSGALSYAKVEKMFEDHQDKWPEAIFNEDAQFKYLDPLIDAGNASYLSMLQGSKEEQRKWWMWNRFRYLDSKYNAGDALTEVVTVRGYAKDNITVTPYASIYATVKYGSYLVQERAQRNVPVTLVNPLDKVNDTEIYIYSADQVADIGDLSGLKIGYGDFSRAVKLVNLKVGDADPNYSNGNLTELYLGNNTLLHTLDVRNCPALTMAVDITGCTNIENVYFDGTSVTAVSLPNGGVLKELRLPATVTNLTVRNQPSLATFYMPSYENITTLRIENSGDAIPALSILSQMPTNSRIRLIGFNLAVSTTGDVESFYDTLDTMRGLDENGDNVDKAQVQGTITGLDSVTGEWLADMQARYPNITITYNHITSKLFYYNYDGTKLEYTETVADGGNGAWTGTSSRAQTAQYTYTFAGWSLSKNATTVDANATKGITADRKVYAVHTATLRKYTVTFVRASVDGGGTLQTINNVNYGTTIVAASRYTGATPTTTQGSATDYPFEGWEPASATVQGNTVFTAKFGSPVEVAEITDSWDTIIANIDNGTYATKYKIGNYKPLDLGTEGTINMQIVAMDVDELADGSGTAPLTFVGMELLNTVRAVHWSTSFTAWENTDMYKFLANTVYPLIPSNVKSRVQQVNKVSANGSWAINTQTTSKNQLWIPSYGEIDSSDTTSKETLGATYYKIFSDANARKRNKNGTVAEWWLRTNDGRFRYYTVKTTGNISGGQTQSSTFGVCLGFCLGLEPETITDS